MSTVLDFTVIKAAGLTQAEFATLVGVSRVSTNMWVRGRMAPHRFIKAKIALVLLQMQSAIEHGDLPLRGPAKSRQAELRAALRAAVARAREEAGIAA